MNNISVVMPVYNVEKYILKSISSICSQTTNNFELIVVDDGSLDSSINILESELEKSTLDYKIIHQHNQGLSAARNTGIRAAQGDWILFVDSDDVIHPNTIELLTYVINNYDTDFVAFNYEKVASIPNSFVSEEISTVKQYQKKDIIYSFYLRNLPFMVTTMLIKKEVIKQNDLYFNVECKFSEDQLYIWSLLFNTSQMVYIPNKLYYYLIREGSIMTASTLNTVLTGYNQFVELDKELNHTLLSEYYSFDLGLILPRWVLGTLHSSAKRMSYKDYRVLEKAINGDNQVLKLIHYPDIRIIVMAIINRVNKRLFYWLAKKI